MTDYFDVAVGLARDVWARQQEYHQRQSQALEQVIVTRTDQDAATWEAIRLLKGLDQPMTTWFGIGPLGRNWRYRAWLHLEADLRKGTV